MSGAEPAILIVDDEAGHARGLGRLVQRTLPPFVATSLEQAKKALDRPNVRWAGVMVDVYLGDGSGFELVDAVQERAEQSPPIMVMSAHAQERVEMINQAFLKTCAFATKPMAPGVIHKFLLDVIAHEAGLSSARGRAVYSLAVKHKLSPLEADLVTRSLVREDHEETLRVRGITDNTYKTAVRRILRKVGTTSMRTICRGLLTERTRGERAVERERAKARSRA